MRQKNLFAEMTKRFLSFFFTPAFGWQKRGFRRADRSAFEAVSGP